MSAMESVRRFFEPKLLLSRAKTVLIPHYITNLILSVLFFVVKTLSPICEILFDNCFLELKQWEWVTFLGCVIVLKNRKQVSTAEYISVACMFAKVLNIVLFYQVNVPYAFAYAILCLLYSLLSGALLHTAYYLLELVTGLQIRVHFVFIPQPVYQGPEFITYFRGPHLKTEIARDKRVTWMVCFYAAWAPSCVTIAPIFSEISAEYHLENFKFGKLDVSKFPQIAEEYKVSTSSFSKQLPTIVLFEEGKEKMRRPAMSAKGTVVKYSFAKQNIIRDYELNEVYNKCKQALPKIQKKEKEETKKEK